MLIPSGGVAQLHSFNIFDYSNRTGWALRSQWPALNVTGDDGIAWTATGVTLGIAGRARTHTPAMGLPQWTPKPRWTFGPRMFPREPAVKLGHHRQASGCGPQGAGLHRWIPKPQKSFGPRMCLREFGVKLMLRLQASGCRPQGATRRRWILKPQRSSGPRMYRRELEVKLLLRLQTSGCRPQGAVLYDNGKVFIYFTG